jgi:hypothetical protein
LSATEISRIRVGDHEVGIVGLQEALEQIDSRCCEESDSDVREALVELVAKKNYIPTSARDNYGKALLREFRIFQGQPQDEPEDSQLRIKVFGPGCYQCDQLEQTIMALLSEMSLPASVEHVTDLKEIARLGNVRLPALMVNGKIVSAGAFLTARRVKELLLNVDR